MLYCVGSTIHRSPAFPTTPVARETSTAVPSTSLEVCMIPLRRILFASCTLLALMILLPAAAAAQDKAADSLRLHQKLESQRTAVDKDIAAVTAELAAARKAAESDGATAEQKEQVPALEARLTDLQGRKTDIDARIGALERGEQVTDMDEWEEWDSEWESDSDSSGVAMGKDWTLWDKSENDDEFDVKNELFKKFPGNYPWMFPLTSRLHESFIRYNRVEGLYLGIAQSKRLYWHSKPKLTSTGSLGYGFLNHRWRYSLGLYLPFYLENQIIEVGGEGHSFTDSKDQWIVDRDENSFTAFFAREDYMDYFSRDGYSVTGAWYYRSEEGLSARASASTGAISTASRPAWASPPPRPSPIARTAGSRTCSSRRAATPSQGTSPSARSRWTCAATSPWASISISMRARASPPATVSYRCSGPRIWAASAPCPDSAPSSSAARTPHSSTASSSSAAASWAMRAAGRRACCA
jgi:hypothetical protein